ncbi:hypothetical protein ACFE04_012308 [Oxalis oulophora]
MQILQTKHFTPNNTLQRLIQIWQHDDSVRVIRLIEEMMKKSDYKGEKLEIIVTIGEEDRERIMNLMLNNNNNNNNNNNSNNNNSNRDCVASLLNIMRNGSQESMISCIKMLEFVAFDAESKLMIVEKEGLVADLVKFVNECTNNELIESSLSCLISITSPKRAKCKLLHRKLVPCLRRKLLDDCNSSISISQKALKLLETMSTMKQGRMEICEDLSCVKALVQKLMKLPAAATEHAVTILWSLCYLFRNQRALEEVTKSNGLTKVLLVMQSNCSPAVQQMCKDLLKIFRVNTKSCLTSYDTKTKHIMPF